MRTANTTFVNLRSTLDTLDPLVTASEPVVSRPGAGNDLQELLPELRGFVADAEPAVADLDRTLVHPGRVNDLKDLRRPSRRSPRRPSTGSGASVNPSAVPYEGNKRSVKGKRRAVGVTRGAFPERRPRRRRPGHRAGDARTPPTCGAGSTTSRIRAGTTL